jgi:molybdenum cofactor biosynthesis enzyme MoaA
MLTDRLSLLPESIGVFLKYNLLRRFHSRPFIPKAIHYIATHQCNARCIMCGIWNDKDAKNAQLSLEQLDRILNDRLFASLKYVGISGGEPFLKGDIVEVSALFHKHCQQLKRLSITTNGTLTEKIRLEVPRLVKLTRDHNTLLNISISCHACDGHFDQIYGISDAVAKIQDTIEVLQPYVRKKELTLSLNTVLLNNNLGHARSLAAWAKTKGIPITFVVGEQRKRFHNDDMQKVFIGSDKEEDLLSFLREQCSDISTKDFSALRYRELIKLLTLKGTRSLPCYYALGGAVLGHDGQLYYCSHSESMGNCCDRSPFEIYYDPKNLAYRRDQLLNKECLNCPPYTLTRWELQTILHRLVGVIVKKNFNSVVRAFRKK